MSQSPGAERDPDRRRDPGRRGRGPALHLSRAVVRLRSTCRETTGRLAFSFFAASTARMRAVGNRAWAGALIALTMTLLVAGCAEEDLTSSDTLAGRVSDGNGADLSGVMITAYDEQRFMSVSVFSAGDGTLSVSRRWRPGAIACARAASASVRASTTTWRCQPRCDRSISLCARPPTFSTSCRRRTFIPCCTGPRRACRGTLRAPAPTAIRSAIIVGASRAARPSGRSSSTA